MSLCSRWLIQCSTAASHHSSTSADSSVTQSASSGRRRLPSSGTSRRPVVPHEPTDDEFAVATATLAAAPAATAYARVDLVQVRRFTSRDGTRSHRAPAVLRPRCTRRRPLRRARRHPASLAASATARALLVTAGCRSGLLLASRGSTSTSRYEVSPSSMTVAPRWRCSNASPDVPSSASSSSGLGSSSTIATGSRLGGAAHAGFFRLGRSGSGSRRPRRRAIGRHGFARRRQRSCGAWRLTRVFTGGASGRSGPGQRGLDPPVDAEHLLERHLQDVDVVTGVELPLDRSAREPDNQHVRAHVDNLRRPRQQQRVRPPLQSLRDLEHVVPNAPDRCRVELAGRQR